MPDWTANEEYHLSVYRSESIDDAPAPEPDLVPEHIAMDVVSAAYAEAYATLEDEDPRRHAELDFNLDGESILIKHIAEAIRAARRAA